MPHGPLGVVPLSPMPSTYAHPPDPNIPKFESTTVSTITTHATVGASTARIIKRDGSASISLSLFRSSNELIRDLSLEPNDIQALHGILHKHLFR